MSDMDEPTATHNPRTQVDSDGTTWTPHEPGTTWPPHEAESHASDPVPEWGFDRNGNVVEMRPWTDLSDIEIVAAAQLCTRDACALMRDDGPFAKWHAASTRRALGFAIQEATRRRLLPTVEDLRVAFDLAASRGEAPDSDGHPITLVDLWAIYVSELR